VAQRKQESGKPKQTDTGLPVRDRTQTGANLGFEAKLWAAADALRNNMDAAEYKHVVLGLIFLKYISDAAGPRVKRNKLCLIQSHNTR